MSTKTTIKNLLGALPLTAELYWQLRQQGKPLSRSSSLRRIQKRLPEWRQQAAAYQAERATMQDGPQEPKRIMFFATLLYWIEHATLLSLALAGQGHQVSLTFLPYTNWRKPFNRFDLRRQNAYMRNALAGAGPLISTVSLLDYRPTRQRALPTLPAPLATDIRQLSRRDTQYTLQVEDIDTDSPLYRLRLERNTQAARAALAYMQAEQPEVVIIPNGSILEMGAVYAVAHHLGIPTVTYEFGEQHERIWLARNAEVMRQETDDLWTQRADQPLTPAQAEQVRTLFASRQRASLWENFARRWQGQPSQGGQHARQALGLDESRPIVLLAANVIGDSLTLGRQQFSASMTEWLERTIADFIRRPEAQLVVRIHPGERYTTGPSVAEVARRVLDAHRDQDCSHIHLVAAGDPINTYDLVEIADLGLVYTTTLGLEMAMSGLPVIVAGQTHYRAKGFTHDPATWDEYYISLQRLLNDPQTGRLTRAQVDQAWNYAYRFFFEYPCPFPWHLLHFWKDIETWPLERLLSPEGQAAYGATFRYLAGAPRDWSQQPPTADGREPITDSRQPAADGPDADNQRQPTAHGQHPTEPA